MNWQKLSIINRHGLKLAGLLRTVAPVEAGGRPGGPDPHPGQPTVLPPLIIVCHGFTGSKEGGGGAVSMADELARLGFASLLFDFTGSGESEGPWEEITLSRQVDDLGAVVDWARSRGYRRIILNGRSFGGTTILAYAAFDRQIAAVCTWAAVARQLQLFSKFSEKRPDLDGPACDRIILVNDNGSIYLKRRFFQDLQHYNLPACAARIAPRPLLLIHGTADEVVPITDAQLLFNAAGDPKKLALVKDADHRFLDHRAQVWDHFFSWLVTLQNS